MNARELLRNGAVGRVPRMSLAMPNYNHAHYIEEALIAIANQTMLPFEVVVVDDGSTDDSIARLQSLAARMPWLRIHRHENNRGVVAAMNTGLGLVRGDFVLGTAADDRLGLETVERAFAAAAEFPATGIIFSDQAEMAADGSCARVMPLDFPSERRHFPGPEFVRVMQRNFFYFHVSNVWFNTELLRTLGGFRPDLRWHSDLFAAYAAGFESGATYVPGAVSYFRKLPYSYSSGARSPAQDAVLRAWLAATREPGWDSRRAAFTRAAIWPEYSLRAVCALQSDLGYLTARLAARIIWFDAWGRIAPFFGERVRHWMRRLRSRRRRARLMS